MLRYNRQNYILRGFDFEGQEALKDARVLVVGLGGLKRARQHGIWPALASTAGATRFDTVFRFQSPASNLAQRHGRAAKGKSARRAGANQLPRQYHYAR